MPEPTTNQPASVSQFPAGSQSFEEIKQAIYDKVGELHQAQRPFTSLRLGKDLYEILNRRLVFRTPAHKELPHFITPFGNLRVQPVHEHEIEHDAFVIE